MNLFDEITYQRGGNLFRMIYHIIGPAPFKAAIHNYLSENAFNTAQMTDLTQVLQIFSDSVYILLNHCSRRYQGYIHLSYIWFVFQNLQDEAPEYDLKSLIERYTLQKNFPVVRVIIIVIIALKQAGKLRYIIKRFSSSEFMSVCGL